MIRRLKLSVEETRGLHRQTTKGWSRHLSSRKWTAGLLGTGCVLFVFCATLVAVCLVSAMKAQALVATANLTLVALGAITGSLITGQSFVDWRHGSESQFGAETINRSVTESEENNTRVYLPKHYDDDGI